MKKTLLTTIAIAAFAVTTGAQAQSPLSYSAGNIFLGFRASGGTGADKSFVFNLGNFSNLTTLGEGATPQTVIDLGSELTTVFGADWKTRGEVKWGIFGMSDSQLPVYSSTSDNRANAPVKKTLGQVGGAYTAYTGMGNNYNSAIENGAYTGSSAGVLGDGVVTGIGANTWYKNIQDAADFGIYNATLEAGVAGDLDFYSTSATAATKLSQYNISSGGVVSVVPEPSTYALFGFGALLLIVAYRRANA